MTIEDARNLSATSLAPSVGRPIEALIRPKSVAVVGASERDGSFGLRLLRAIRSGRYEGRVYPVNPRYETIEGLDCHSSLAVLPEVPDLVTFAVSDELTERVLAEAAEAGVPAAALFGRGYEPPDGNRPPMAERLSRIAREAGMAVCGNNCMGFVNLVDGLKVSGNPPPIPERPGTIGFVSHSGSTWSGMVGNQRGLLFNYAISSGQEIATTMADYIQFLLDQPETRVIGCVMETVRDPATFLAAAERADAKGIPIVVLKLGRSDLGRRFALAHSGALAGSDAVYGAVFERHNLIRVDTVDEMCDTLEMLNASRRPASGGIGVVTDSGGERELIVDVAADVGAPIANLTPETSERLVEVLDPGMSPVNPVDSFGDGQMLFEGCLNALAADPGVGVVALATNLVAGRTLADRTVDVVERVYSEIEKPLVLFGNLHSAISREHAARLRAQGVPVLMGTRTSLLALRHAIAWQAACGTAGTRTATGDTATGDTGLPSTAEVSRLIEGDGDGPLTASASARLMDLCGLPCAPSVFVHDEEAAISAAARLGYPVVLKTANPNVLHKTERGGVHVALANETAVAGAYRAISRSCGPAVQVQAMANRGVEIILGMTADPQFGPAITIGLGGVLTELIGDAVTLMPPISAASAGDHLARLKSYPLLSGYRGGPPADLDALTAFIARFSEFCAAFGPMFEEIDLNPVIVTPSGALAVDALFIPSTRKHGRQEMLT